MTNSDCNELVKLADELIAQNYGNVRDIDTMGEHFALLAKAATALRRLASSDSGVKGEPEPVAWSKVCNPPTVSGTYIVGGYIDDGTLPRHFERDFALFRQTDDGPEWSLSGKRNIPIEYWHDIPAHPEHRDAIVTSPPADAGMREALGNLLAYAERNECPHESTSRGGAIWTICDDCGRKWADDRGGFKPYVEPAEIAAARAALTAPGTTTKSDGGCMADFSPGDPANLKELMASKPVWSDPSSTRSDAELFERHTGLKLKITDATRSEVTVEELARFINGYTGNDENGNRCARALLDQFEIRRK